MRLPLQIIALAGLASLSACCCPDKMKSSDISDQFPELFEASRPTPQWTAPDKYINYWRWECPAGWTEESTISFTSAEKVFCESDAEEKIRMENWGRKQEPVGHQ
jgi:hypothetical protein